MCIRDRDKKNPEERPEGEHEASYEKHFGPLWYWFEHKNSGFVVLYTDEGNLKTGVKGYSKPEFDQMSRRQLDWLETSLEKLADKDHVFVFLHHPRWMKNRYGGSNWGEVHRRLKKPGNVRAVFAGHIHRMHYDGERDGIEYFALASVGASIQGIYPGLGYLHQFNVVSVRRRSFAVSTLPVGEVMDLSLIHI